MSWYIGVDVGGTHIDCLAINDDGSKVEYHHPRPIDTLPEELVPEIISFFMRDFSIKSKDLKTLAIGWKHGRDQHRTTAMLQRFAKLKLSPKIFWHIESLFHAALPEQVGILVFSGTNSITYGQTSSKSILSSGGWSELLGDPGSAFAVGKEAIVAALRARNGGTEKTVLLEKVPEYLHMSLDEILILSDSHIASAVIKIASLGKLVFETAKGGDYQSIHIRENAAKALIENTISVLNRWPKSDPAVITYGGRVLSWETDFRYQIISEIKKHHPSIEWREPEFRAPYGPLLCANPKLISLIESVNSKIEGHR